MDKKTDTFLGTTRSRASRPLRRLARRIGFLQEETAPERPLRICDVGANPINTPDYEDLLDLGACEVWGFEPAEGPYNALIEDPKPGTHYLRRAVGRTGRAKFYDHPQSGLSSIFPISRASVEYLDKPRWFRSDLEPFDIDLVALDDMSDEELPKPDLLKIDIQGGELDVLETGRNKLSDAVCVIPEIRFFRIYEGEPVFGQVDSELHRQGYVLHKFLFAKSSVIRNSQRHKMRRRAFRNQLLDGDAVYVRDPVGIKDWTGEQVKQLAMAAAGMFSSLDLAVACLDELVRRKIIAAEAPARFVDQLPAWMLKPEGRAGE